MENRCFAIRCNAETLNNRSLQRRMSETQSDNGLLSETERPRITMDDSRNEGLATWKTIPVPPFFRRFPFGSTDMSTTDHLIVSI
uniref:Uncharacterized protein n=1 Tax=Sphaerodactylus townsendi TaxID=933632 RepID=A0ACB8E5E9_9SAUR